jgi:hypothetical protein
MFQVYKKRCDECLFSDNKIVVDETKQTIIDACIAKNTHFICHKSSIHNDDQVCCRGFYDQFKNQISKLMMARGLGVVEFIDLPKTQS